MNRIFSREKLALLRQTGALFLFVALLISCANDSLPPLITMENPKDGEKIHSGMHMAIDLHFSDNDNLRQYKLDLHSAADGHAHGKQTAILPEFDTLIIGNLNGMEQTVNLNIHIPNHARSGEYHLTVFALDYSGNEGQLTRILHIYNTQDTIAPVITITAPANGATFQQQLQVEAHITDKRSDGSDGALGSITVRLVRIDSPTQVHTLGNFHQNDQFADAFNPTTGLFSKNFPISGIASGEYRLELLVMDETGNMAEQEITIVKN